MIAVKKHMELLGLPVVDRVTGFKGTVECVSFDLYGCIQATVRPKGTDKEGKTYNSAWFDVSRLEIKSNTPVITVPNFDYGDVAEGRHGCADKPQM